MAIIPGHAFHKEHGFTGSAEPNMNMKPAIPGFKHGGMEHEKEHDREDRTGHHSRTHLKKGGKVDGKDHYSKGGHVDHDGHSHTGNVHYDNHGFQHLAHGGKSAKHHSKKQFED